MHPPQGCGAIHRGGEGDDPEIAAKLRIEERELEAGGLNYAVQPARNPAWNSPPEAEAPLGEVVGNRYKQFTPRRTLNGVLGEVPIELHGFSIGLECVRLLLKGG